MHLTPKEMERALLFSMAELARKRKAKCLKLNYPEALALICDEVLEAAREDRSFAEVTLHGCNVLEEDEVMDGVAELLASVQLEAVFTDGTKLVTLDRPIKTRQQGLKPGQIEVAAGAIILNAGKPVQRLEVRNTSPYPIWVGSHFPFHKVNRRLHFDRQKAEGWHLDLPAGQILGFAPSESKTVELVPLRPNPLHPNPMHPNPMHPNEEQ